MKAIILAAGEGTRLNPLTLKIPKCLIPVSGKPILQYQIEAFNSIGVEEIIIIVGYRAVDIIKYISSLGHNNVKIIENKNYTSTNNMYSLWLARSELLDHEFFLANGDIVFSTAILKRLNKSDVIICKKDCFNEESMKIAVIDGYIQDISKQIAHNEVYGLSIDLYSFSLKSARILFTKIEEIVEQQKDISSWTEVAMQQLFHSSALQMKPFNMNQEELWMEIDNSNDLLMADRLFSKIDFDKKKLWFIDLDGTIFLGSKIITGAKEFINILKEKNLNFFFLSNNSSKSKHTYVEKLTKLGISITLENIILSTDGVVAYLHAQGLTDIFIVGTDSMREDIQAQGFNITPQSPQAVVLGYDTEINYEKLKTAALLIQEGLPFIATHPDKVCPTPEGPIPDIGSMIELFRVATGRKPQIFGKPNKSMIEHVIKKSGYSKDEIVLIGDRLYTDEKLAQNIGIDFICVLSGETNIEDIKLEGHKPELLVHSVADLVSILS